FLSARVFPFIAAAWMSACDWAIFELAPGGAYQHLRGRSQNVCIPRWEKIHIRRWVHRAQCAISVEGGDFGREVQPQGEHELEDIACGDVFFGALHRFYESLAAGFRANLELAIDPSR